MCNLFGLLICFIYIISILIFSAKLKRFGDEVSRKFAHITISNSWFMINHLFTNPYMALLVPLFMIVIMLLSEKFDIFKGLKRENSDISYGTVCYFLSMLILIIISLLKFDSLIPLGGFFLLLGYGDAFAALIGKKYPVCEYKVFNYTKSISGNVAMLIVSFIANIIYVGIYGLEYSIIQLIFISCIATMVEAFSVKGVDNFTIPILSYISYDIVFNYILR